MENQYKKRTRVEVSTSVKGVKTYSCTTEMIDAEMDAVLAESDRLIQELDRRYPAQIGEGK